MEENTASLLKPEKLKENVENVLKEKDMNAIGNSTSEGAKDPTLVKKKKPTSARKPFLTALAIETHNGEIRLVEQRVFHSGVPVNLFNRQTTTVQPFSFEERNKATQERKQENLQKIREAQKQQCTTFHARPVPSYLKRQI